MPATGAPKATSVKKIVIRILNNTKKNLYFLGSYMQHGQVDLEPPNIENGLSGEASVVVSAMIVSKNFPLDSKNACCLDIQ